MGNFHIKPDSGEPGKCSAEAGRCPFRGESKHYDTAEEARGAYEQEMSALEKVDQLKTLADELVKTTLARREVLDERKKFTAADPQWAEIRVRVREAKVNHEKAMEKAAKIGLTPHDLILGVQHNGNLYNGEQVWRVRPYAPEEYSRMAGVTPMPGSKVPIPGDLEIEKKKSRWAQAKSEFEELPEGSEERARAKNSLIKRVVRDVPSKRALERLKTGLSTQEVIRLMRSGPGVGEAWNMKRKAGIETSEEGYAHEERFLKSAQDFIDSLDK